MLSKTLVKSNSKQIVSILLINSCLNFRRSFGVSCKFDGFVSNSCVLGYNHLNVFIASLSIGIRILPLFGARSCFRGPVRYVVTQSIPDKPDIPEEVINQVLSCVESPASSSKEFLNKIVRIYRTGNGFAVAKLLQLINSKKLFLGSGALGILLSETSRRCDVELSLQIFRDLIKSSESLSLKSYCNLAEAYVNTDDCDKLLICIKEISELTYCNSVLVLNRIIFAFAEARQVEKALMIFNFMKTLKCKPDLVTYNTVLGILGRTGRLDEMVQEFASMKECDIAPDTVTYNTLLNSLQKFGKLDLCFTITREMYEKRVNLDLRTYTALIEMFGRSGHIDEALKMLNSMKETKVGPSIYIYRSLINNLKKMGKLEAAASLLDEMNHFLPYLVCSKDFKKKYK